ncbi:hypothetical protein PAHAL_7G039100 [Panicum hallii]|uniref:Uncharacterized protein n=1 Tax=Panicum hallii TaxID=206008 RepID=A0A2T8IAX1_9POAL|nr:hypothetical protein PAHAL_7G039100 [Panicum hallii]
MTCRFKSRLAGGLGGRTSQPGWVCFTPSPLSTGWQAPHPPSIWPIRRPGPARGDYLSIRGFRCVAHFLPFHHPPTPLPQKTPQPPSFSSPSPPPPPYIRARRTRTRSGGRKQQAAPAPSPFLAADRRRSGPPARGGCRSGPGRRCVQSREAVCSFLQLPATISNGFHHLSNRLLVLYLRFSFFML